jgi:nitrogen fixation NifU-like protein
MGGGIVYSDKVIKHFLCPYNVGSIPEADGEGVAGDTSCGDYLTIYIKVKDGVIDNIRFLVRGCAAAIATSSMTTVLAKQRMLEEALKITEEDIIEALDGLPESKQHCSNLGVSALRSAIQNYLSKIR